MGTNPNPRNKIPTPANANANANSQFIKELEGWQGKACVVKIQSRYFVVSSVNSAFDTGMPETLAFNSDAEGNVDSFFDVAGGRFMTREEVIAELENQTNDPEKTGRGMFGEPI